MHPRRTLAEWGQRLDVGGLKRLGAITYFGVYALLFVAHRPVAWVVAPSVDPVWMLVDLPQSLAMGVLSFSVTIVVVGIAAVRDASGEMAQEQPSTGASAAATETGTASRGASTAPATRTNAHGMRADTSTTTADRPGTGSGTTNSAATEPRAVDPAPTRQPTSQAATERQPSTAATATGAAGSDSGAETVESAAVDMAAGPDTDRPRGTDGSDEPAAADDATAAEEWPGEWIGGNQL